MRVDRRDFLQAAALAIHKFSRGHPQHLGTDAINI
jgi:hypothetical protein